MEQNNGSFVSYRRPDYSPLSHTSFSIEFLGLLNRVSVVINLVEAFLCDSSNLKHEAKFVICSKCVPALKPKRTSFELWRNRKNSLHYNSEIYDLNK